MCIHKIELTKKGQRFGSNKFNMGPICTIIQIHTTTASTLSTKFSDNLIIYIYV